jgi:hypothetical protein
VKTAVCACKKNKKKYVLKKNVEGAEDDWEQGEAAVCVRCYFSQFN